MDKLSAAGAYCPHDVPFFLFCDQCCPQPYQDDGIIIRQLDRSDSSLVNRVAEVQSLMPMFFPEPKRQYKPSANIYFSCRVNLLEKNHLLLVAQDKGQDLIAYHQVCLNDPLKDINNECGLIAGTWVNDHYRRKGIAKTLKHIGENWLLKNNLHSVKTYVDASNYRVIKLNESMGYRIVAYEMRKELTL